ncbi:MULTISPECIES: transcription elongation factor subunit Spt4 [unclassified Archaeoglobus]|jgi:DNA-directed RNA polymerase subunit E"|uniref:transcription elongation factor subunit Spt4 n=1 Tax=unclassified Archaeoglobus TaxID=2643606 RepID=UPI0025C6A42C|nr:MULTISPECIES: transcription elongation factor subunit Spt4 [unclassified Archaeoglobus]
MAELACRNCKFINVDSSICKNCGSSELTKEWYGYVVIIDPEKSEIAKRLDIKIPGKYALRVG